MVVNINTTIMAIDVDYTIHQVVNINTIMTIIV